MSAPSSSTASKKASRKRPAEDSISRPGAAGSGSGSGSSGSSSSHKKVKSSKSKKSHKERNEGGTGEDGVRDRDRDGDRDIDSLHLGGLSDKDISSNSRAIPTFEAMGLKTALLRGIYNYGFEKPSAIQQRAIKPILQGHDMIAQSQSGTGKTAVFSIGILQSIDTRSNLVQAIALSPTRELAGQTAKVVSSIGDFMNVRCIACVGGKAKSLSEDMLIIDEADEMFIKGFKDVLYDIYRYLPDATQVILVSATLPKEIVEMSSKFMSDPIRVLVKRDELSLDCIKQYHVDCEEEQWKFEVLCDLYQEGTGISQTVIFCNTRKKVDWLSKKLKTASFSVSSMHGEMAQEEREAVMSAFRSGGSRVLITTDVWGRGIDVQQVSLVVNYDLPAEDQYLHRIGRSGRFGRQGIAINFSASNEDMRIIRGIEKHYSITIGPLPANFSKLL
eukprot:GSChrysophyteH2.ASY1.ANO1.1137.1 assembled CDS